MGRFLRGNGRVLGPEEAERRQTGLRTLPVGRHTSAGGWSGGRLFLEAMAGDLPELAGTAGWAG